MTLPVENWKQSRIVPNYDVSTQGRVRSRKTGRVMKPFLSKAGYWRIALVVAKGVRKKFLVSRLVAFEFCGGHQADFDVDHIDFNTQNNEFLNLRWLSPEDNRGRKQPVHKQRSPRRQLELDLQF